jgi:putative ATPase
MTPQTNLFGAPLAERMRPKTIDDFVGQASLLGPGKALRRMLEERRLVSMIFWGPPGSGKTTLSRILARAADAEWFELSAVSSGVKDVREVMQKGEAYRKIGRAVVLFIDEIHRFTKSQQDALLHAVERGVVTLVGATTENPSFEVISPLLSRCRVFVLEPLGTDHLLTLLDRALASDDAVRGVELEDREFLAGLAGGDARVMFNALELAATLAPADGDRRVVTNAILADVFQRRLSRYDKEGEEHYNIISAFIKSMRGSDPDAAVYYLARMIDGGEDPLFIARRMVVLASEDVGNADPFALVVAANTFQAIHQIGMPEGRIVLAQCATYLASAPKSNASYLAIESALADVAKHPNEEIPLHLRNAPTALMKKLDYGKDYKYAHSYEGHFVETDYLPERLTSSVFYHPTAEGREKFAKERLERLWAGKKKY